MFQGKFSYDNVFSMRYLDQVISESLRFYPPVTGFITRTCQHDYEYNGLKIPAGMSVLIPPYQLHHDPNLWSEPEKFDPESSARNKDDERDTLQNRTALRGPGHAPAHVPLNANV
ncbi:unnamed protein product, partial [Ixodes pacificus]